MRHHLPQLRLGAGLQVPQHVALVRPRQVHQHGRLLRLHSVVVVAALLRPRPQLVLGSVDPEVESALQAVVLIFVTKNILVTKKIFDI